MFAPVIVIVLIVIGIIAAMFVLVLKNRPKNDTPDDNDTSSKLNRIFYSRSSTDCCAIDLNKEKVMPAILIADYGNRMIRYGAMNSEGSITHKTSIPFDAIIDFWIEKKNDHLPIQSILLIPLSSIFVGIILGVAVAFFSPFPATKYIAAIIPIIAIFFGAECFNSKRERMYEQYRRTNIKLNIVTTSHSSPLISFQISPKSVQTSIEPECIDVCCAKIEAMLKQVIKYYKQESDYNCQPTSINPYSIPNSNT